MPAYVKLPVRLVDVYFDKKRIPREEARDHGKKKFQMKDSDELDVALRSGSDG